MEFGIKKCAIQTIKNGRKRDNGRKRTEKSGKYQNTWREGKLQVLWNVDTIKQMERKKKGKCTSEKQILVRILGKLLES